MESLQISSPRRHIHSSFPHYFYSTPSSPSSDTISAFVALCESRIKSNDEFAFSFSNSTDGVAFAEDLFYGGQLLPVAPPPAPLKLPPRLQYIANIRKSLRVPRIRRSRRHKVPASPRVKDPFVVAVEKVTREDAPWCQLPTWGHRRPKAEIRKEVDVEYVESTISSSDRLISYKEETAGLIIREESRKKSSWISMWLRNFTIKGKERSRVKDEKDDGKLVNLGRCTSVSRRSKSQGQLKFLGCFSF